MVQGDAAVGLIKAINHLFGGLTNYLTAWTRRPTQAVNDKTDAKSEVVKAIARAAAEKAASDPELVEAAVQAWLPKEFRKQENKAAVIEQATQALLENQENQALLENGATPAKDRDIESDWLNSFERYCEDASSEKMRQLWGRVLAGEVAKPGAFSKTAIRLISELDQSLAVSFEKVLQHSLANTIFLADTSYEKENVDELLELEAAGMISGVSGYLSWTPNIDDRGLFTLAGRCYGLVGKVSKMGNLSAPVIALSKIGIQLREILPETDETSKLRSVSKYLTTRDRNFSSDAVISGIALCTINEQKGAGKSLELLEVLWGDDPFSNN
ncbi:DUF2806 domain-containing protein [Altererythrobacter sp. CAU 1778]